MGMRRGTKGAGIWSHEGVPVAAMLGWDHTAEHEWGIDPLRRTFDCHHEDEMGIERYRVGSVGDGALYLVEREAYVYLGTREPRDEDEWPHRELTIRPPWRDEEPETFTSAWSDGDFGALATDEEGRAFLRELHRAFLDGDAAIFVGAPPVPGFSNGGLTLAIVSRVPQEGLDAMREAHEEQARLERYTAKVERETQLREKLEKAGRRWFYLGSRFMEEDHPKRERTAYEIQYWLNPMDQRSNNAGWYTVEDLLQWADGEGPVPK